MDWNIALTESCLTKARYCPGDSGRPVPSPAAVAGLSVAQVTTGGGAGPGPEVPHLRTSAIWRAIYF